MKGILNKMGRYAEVEKLETKFNLNEDKYGVTQRPNEFGICSKCMSFKIRKTKLMDEEVWCEKYTKRLLNPNKVDPIVECSDFYPVGMLSLYEMYSIAYIIDVKEKKTIGFNHVENDIEIKKPTDEED